MMKWLLILALALAPLEAFAQVRDFTAFASVARTATEASAAYNQSREYPGLLVYWNVTACSTCSADLVLQYREPVGGTWVDYLTLFAAVTSTGQSIALVHPIAGAATSATEFIAPMPTIWRLRIVHNNANSMTSSVGGLYIR